jgi:hypothetical protein
MHEAQRFRPKEVADVPPKYLSTEIKVVNNPEMSEYNLTAIFIWPLLYAVVCPALLRDTI